MKPRLSPIIAVLLLSACAAVTSCEEGGGDGESGSGNSCDIYEFEYEGEPVDGVCPPVECCPGDGQGTFSVYDRGRCLSGANCEVVCEDTDAAFECVF